MTIHLRSLTDVVELGGILMGAVVLWIIGDKEPMVDMGDGLPLIRGDEDGFADLGRRE